MGRKEGKFSLLRFFLFLPLFTIIFPANHFKRRRDPALRLIIEREVERRVVSNGKR